jgi:hypothetical protein
MNPVQQFIYEYPDPGCRNIMDLIRHFILSENHAIKEKITHGIPFFYIQKNLCYLNPSPSGVDLAFVRGHKMPIEMEGFKFYGRKQVKSLRIKTIDEIDFDKLKILLNMAVHTEKK